MKSYTKKYLDYIVDVADILGFHRGDDGRLVEAAIYWLNGN